MAKTWPYMAKTYDQDIMCAKTYNVWKRITCYPYPLVGFSLHRIPWFIGVQTPHTLEQQPTAYSWKQKNHTRTRGLGITSRFQQSERTGCKHEETRRLLWCQCRVRLALEPHKSVSSCLICSGMCIWAASPSYVCPADRPIVTVNRTWGRFDVMTIL